MNYSVSNYYDMMNIRAIQESKYDFKTLQAFMINTPVNSTTIMLRGDDRNYSVSRYYLWLKLQVFKNHKQRFKTVQ